MTNKERIELRDYFAGKVLQGIFANNERLKDMSNEMDKYAYYLHLRDVENDNIGDYVAQQCYNMADAMLRERNHA